MTWPDALFWSVVVVCGGWLLWVWRGEEWL